MAEGSLKRAAMTGTAKVTIVLESRLGVKTFETTVPLDAVGTDEQFNQALQKASNNIVANHYRKEGQAS
ncbi:hypothetical protein [Erwinia sp. Leaf53]|uniref:hypothetical protein n=1 Tax=Erwinia sp. Leaf53 TaxID=1736225 RepID=UPI000A8C398D|nr:hypothetical protein [Erwinia sp. Leaf53]